MHNQRVVKQSEPITGMDDGARDPPMVNIINWGPSVLWYSKIRAIGSIFQHLLVIEKITTSCTGFSAWIACATSISVLAENR